MNTPVPQNTCPECGAPLTPGAAQGLCARCLLAGAAAPTEHTAPRSAPPVLEQIATAFPQLEVLELIGHGGMGAVFKVRQPKLDRFAALKLLPQSLAADPAFASRFEREARLLARLNHANIVAVYDHGQAGEFFYLLMEYVDGVNLRQAMRASRFTPAQALGIVPKICEALQYAHDEGVLHRDIKPENILLDAKGRVKLADFGIAKLTGDGTHESHESHEPHPSKETQLTRAGAALGTPQYMAPEQRDTPGDVDHRADIYSLGVVFYELLTGELPVGRFAPPSEISAADPRVDAIVRQALEKERERRQHSAGEMKTQVETLGAPAPWAASASAHPSAGAVVPSGLRGTVGAPAMAMMIVGMLGLFSGPLLALLTYGFTALLHHTIFPQLPVRIMSFGGPGGGLLAAVLLFVELTASVFVFIAGLRMWRLRSRVLAVTGSIVLIALALFSLLSLWAWPYYTILHEMFRPLMEIAVGIWALTVLSRREIRAAFDGGTARGLADAPGQPHPDTAAEPAGRVSRAPRRLRTPVVIVVLILIAGWAVLVASFFQPDIYFAKAVIELRSKDFGPNMPRDTDPTYIALQLEEIRNPEALEVVVQQLGLERIFSKNGQPLSLAEAATRLSNLLEVRAIPNTRLVEIGDYQRDPQLAAAIANFVAMRFKEHRQRAMQTSLGQLKVEVEKQHKWAEASMAEATDIRVQNGIIDPDPMSMESSVSIPDRPGDIELKMQLAAYVKAKAGALQHRSILQAAEVELETQTDLLNRSIDFDPAVIRLTANPYAEPVPSVFRRLLDAVSR